MAGGSEDFPTGRPSESSLLRKSCFRKTPEPLQKTKIGQKEREREREGRGKKCSKNSQSPALTAMLMQAASTRGWSGGPSGDEALLLLQQPGRCRPRWAPGAFGKAAGGRKRALQPLQLGAGGS